MQYGSLRIPDFNEKRLLSRKRRYGNDGQPDDYCGIKRPVERQRIYPTGTHLRMGDDRFATSATYADCELYWLGSSDVTLYAVWSAQGSSDRTVTFNANGASGTMANQTIAEGARVPLNANEFTRTGIHSPDGRWPFHRQRQTTAIEHSSRWVHPTDAVCRMVDHHQYRQHLNVNFKNTILISDNFSTYAFNNQKSMLIKKQFQNPIPIHFPGR
jgi:hypothetical protein